MVELARKSGSAVIIGHPYKETLAALKAWISVLDGMTLVPITTLLNQLSRVAVTYR